MPHFSYVLASMPSGGVHSIFLAPISFQLVDSTVPFDSCMESGRMKESNQYAVLLPERSRVGNKL